MVSQHSWTPFKVLWLSEDKSSQSLVQQDMLEVRWRWRWKWGTTLVFREFVFVILFAFDFKGRASYRRVSLLRDSSSVWQSMLVDKLVDRAWNIFHVSRSRRDKHITLNFLQNLSLKIEVSQESYILINLEPDAETCRKLLSKWEQHLKTVKDEQTTQMSSLKMTRQAYWVKSLFEDEISYSSRHNLTSLKKFQHVM